MHACARPIAASARGASLTPHAVKLYSNPASRGRIVEWYLKEIGRDAEIVNMDMGAKQHKQDTFLKVNPFGKVPALEDGDLKLFESGALLTYLADKYGELKTAEDRARASQWVLFANSTLANSLFIEQFRGKAMPEVLGTLDSVLTGREWLEGEFGVSDVAVGSYLLYLTAFFPDTDLSAYPSVVAYMKRLEARPACAATVAARASERAGEEAAKAGKS